MFRWIVKRLFSTENIGYIVEKVRPSIQEELDNYIKITVDNLLTDEEFHKRLTEVGDAYYERYKKKTLGFIGGKQKGLNYQSDQKQGGLGIPNVFNEEGGIDLMKSVKFLMSGGLKQLQPNTNQARSNAQRGKEGQNAPEM